MSRTDHEKRKKFRESIGRKSLAPGNLQEQAILYASWRSPNTVDAKGGTRNGSGQVQVCHQVQLLASWPTPSAQGSAGEISEDWERRGEKWVNKKTGRVLQTNLATDVKMLTSWPTPATRDYRHANAKPWAERGGGKKGEQLNNAVVHQAAWPTPTAQPDNKSPEAHLAMKKRMGERDGTGANRTAITDLQVMAKISGPPPSGSPAGTGSGGQLNPAFVRWLMGYPTEWDD